MFSHVTASLLQQDTRVSFSRDAIVLALARRAHIAGCGTPFRRAWLDNGKICCFAGRQTKRIHGAVGLEDIRVCPWSTPKANGILTRVLPSRVWL
jgi:hypothetical protein